MTDQFSRTRLIFGQQNIQKLKNSHVIVFGAGGVGSFAIEALARTGIGKLTIVDSDEYSLTNLNRQLYALHSTIGKSKVEVAKERIKDINPECIVQACNTFYLPENANQFNFSQYDYIVDCIDTVSAKIDIILRAKKLKIPVISAMGAGNKVDPTKLKVADISRTSVCPLARVMRNELKKRGINRLKCVFSTEPAIKPDINLQNSGEIEMKGKAASPGSNAFVPSVAGLFIASEVVRDLCSFHVTDLFKNK